MHVYIFFFCRFCLCWLANRQCSEHESSHVRVNMEPPFYDFPHDTISTYYITSCDKSSIVVNNTTVHVCFRYIAILPLWRFNISECLCKCHLGPLQIHGKIAWVCACGWMYCQKQCGDMGRGVGGLIALLQLCKWELFCWVLTQHGEQCLSCDCRESIRTCIQANTPASEFTVQKWNEPNFSKWKTLRWAKASFFLAQRNTVILWYNICTCDAQFLSDW